MAFKCNGGSFLSKTWPSWSEFESEFAEYCRKGHQVYATLDSRTVDRQNAGLSENAVRYKPELKYA